MCQACKAKTWNDLQKMVSFEDAKKALHKLDYDRTYRKDRYHKNAAILAEAKRRGIDKEITVV